MARLARYFLRFSPTSVRYTGSALTFNLAGILVRRLPFISPLKLAENYGLGAVGLYLSLASILFNRVFY